MHNYHDTHDHFPPGTVPNADLPPDQRLAFTVALLPFLELEQLHKDIRPEDSVGLAAQREGAAEGAGVTQYRCPSVPATGRTGEDPLRRHRRRRRGRRDPPADFARRGHVRVRPQAHARGREGRHQQHADGDGDEPRPRALDPRRADDRGGIDPADEPLVGAGRAFGGNHVTDKTIFRKAKPVGSTVLMADASARVVGGSVSTDLLKNLATIAGGEEIPTDW